MLSNRQYVFSRTLDDISVIVAVNNDDHNYGIGVAVSNVSEYIGAISGERIPVQNGHIYINIKPHRYQ